MKSLDWFYHSKSGRICQNGLSIITRLRVNLLLLGFLFAFIPLATSQFTFSPNRIDSVFKDVDLKGSPGCMLMVMHKGKIVYSRGYGYSNLDYEIPIDEHTVMGTGSVTKQFVAAAILKASLQGSLSLDDDIRKWIPDFPDYGHEITIRHLIHHTSGIRDEAQLRAVGNLADDITRKEIVDLLKRQYALNFPPGEKWMYSNGGYFLLGEIIEHSTKMSIQDYLEKEFFVPLGLKSIYHGRFAGIIPKAANSYDKRDGQLYRRSHVGEVAGIRTNTRDLARWSQALADDELWSKGFQKLQLEKGILNNGDTISYAFGLDIGEHRGLPVIRHGGSGEGYRTGMAIYPGEELVLCTMCNLSNIDAVSRVRNVAEIILEDKMNEPMPAVSGGDYSMPWPAPPGEAINLTRNQLEVLTGNYFSPELNVVFEVKVKGQGLIVGPDGWQRSMEPTAISDRFTDGRGWAQITFTRGDNGDISGFIMDIGRVNGLILNKLTGE